MMSRYDASGSSESEYMDAKGTVMKNKKGIIRIDELHKAEEESLAAAYDALFREIRSATPLTLDLILHIHSRIFGDLYEWAGRWRTVRISKPGVAWPPPDFLDETMRDFERDFLKKYRASSLKDDEDFCRAAAHIQGEFLSIHPFREGNARTIKLLTNLLASQTKRPPLRYDMTQKGQELYIQAAKEALHQQKFSRLETIICSALKRAKEFI